MLKYETPNGQCSCMVGKSQSGKMNGITASGSVKSNEDYGTDLCAYCSSKVVKPDNEIPKSDVQPSKLKKITDKRKQASVRHRNEKENLPNTTKCTACSTDSLKTRGCKHPNDAEVLHPILLVPICNSCFMAFKQSQQQLEVIDILESGKLSSDENISSTNRTTDKQQSQSGINNEDNKPYCIWCGFGDGCELFFCDSCTFSFCSDCVRQNFGQRESNRVKKLEVWSCYACAPTEQMTTLQSSGRKSVDNQSPHSIAYTSLEKAISVASKNGNTNNTASGSSDDLSDLSDGEFFFLSLLLGGSSCTTTKVYNFNRRTRFHQLDGILDSLCIVPTYLKACDYISAIFRLSVKLRRCLRSSLGGQVILTPGLFKTEYGEEFQCRLHPHQLTSLKRMTDIENNPAAKAFNALRGGIFADEPGLGKTVTSLALITSTAGLLPQRPVASWEKQDVNNDWQKLRGQFETHLNPIIMKICKRTDHGDNIDYLWNLAADIKREEKHCETIQTFENAVRVAIRRTSRNRLVRERLFDILREEMLLLREGLDSSLRKFKHSSSPSHVRIRYERSLMPSAATLIVVPQNLLEHWYEQIIRHLNLEFFSSDEGAEGVAAQRSIGRGVVYLDGLGDIVDVQSPLSKLHIKATINSTYLSTYFIVVTTFERCIIEDMKAAKVATFEDDNYSLKDSQLLTIRWLRLIVDEGHELGKKVDVPKKKGSSHNGESDNAQHLQRFVSNIAAERRWVMSGTPTSGTDTKAGLFQLHRILLFLRHPLWGGCADLSDGRHGNQKRRRISASSSGGSRPDESASGAVSDVPHQDNQEAVISEIGNGNSRKENNNSSNSSSSSSSLYSSNDINSYNNSSSSSSNSSSSSANNGIILGTGSSSSSSSDNNGIIVGTSSSSSGSSSSSSNISNALVTPEQTSINTVPPLARSIRSSSSQESSLKQWRSEIVKPCINQNQLSWEYLIELLSQIMVRHTKDDLQLFEPIYRSVNLGSLSDPMEVDHLDAEQERMRAIDRAKATYIANVMRDAQRAYKKRNPLPTSPSCYSHSSAAAAAQNRRPKAIVFSPNKAHLQGVGHFLYLDMGDVNLCEHFGEYRSSELSRFRNSRSKYRECPLCGYHNPITNDNFCTQTLLAVEYVDVDEEEDTSNIAPEPAGHGAQGPGGHYAGSCLCSPHGCEQKKENMGMEEGNQHFPNPFNTVPELKQNPNAAIILPSHIFGFDISQVDWDLGQMVTVIPAPATKSGPLLWRGGRMGGRARVSTWKPCGGRSKFSCWHPGDQILSAVPWRTQEEDASVLLLAEDGSTGLDLSFATHLFILERIKDPALHNQIVSRAHRMGATGPVEVTLIQVRSTEGQSTED